MGVPFDEAPLSIGTAAKSGYGMRTIFDLWPVLRLGQTEKQIGMEHMAFVSKSSLPVNLESSCADKMEK